MIRRLRFLAFLAAGAAFASMGGAQTAPAPAAPAAAPAPKVAVTSLVGDFLTVTLYRERVGTSLQSNQSSALPMPGPMIDHQVLKAAKQALERMRPGVAVAPLRVPAAGSSTDPAQMVAGDALVAGNALVDALRQQGYTHLVLVTRHRAPTAIRLRDGVFGTGQLEGLGFYIDPTIRVESTTRAERAEGIIAPHAYLQLRLADLASLKVVASQTITTTSVVPSTRNPDGVDPWGALTPEQKIAAINQLIDTTVGPAVTALFEGR